MTERVVSFEEACAKYVHRYTMEHVPACALRRPCDDGGTATWYYAPQYRSDREWYDNTIFPGEAHLSPRSNYCESSNPTWPLGRTLDAPYHK